MLCFFLFFISREAFWFCLCDATLRDLLYLMLDFTSTTSWYAVGSSPYHVMLHDLVFMMLRCLTLSTSCNAASIFLNLSSRCYAACCWQLHATLLRFPHFIPSCFMSFFSRLKFFFMMLYCLVFFTSCCTAWRSLHHVILLYLHQITSFGLILSSWCYAAWLLLSASCYGASPSLPHVKLLHLLYIRSRYLILSLWRYAAWPSLPHATRTDPPHAMFCCILTKPCYTAWSGLHDASLLGLHCLMLSCLIFSASCRTAWCPLYQVTLLDLVSMMLHYLIFSASCCAAEPPLPRVMLLDVLYIRACYLIWSS